MFESQISESFNIIVPAEHFNYVKRFPIVPIAAYLRTYYATDRINEIQRNMEEGTGNYQTIT